MCTSSADFHVAVGNLAPLGGKVSKARRIVRLSCIVDSDIGKVGIAGSYHGPKE